MKETNFLHYVMAASAVLLTFCVIWIIISNNPDFTRSDTLPTQPIVQTQQFPQYPINMEVITYIVGVDLDETVVDKTNSDKLISIVNKVSYNPEIKKYIYNYELTYNGKKNTFLLWGVLDHIIHGESISQTPHLVELIPNKTQKFEMKSDLPPALYEGFAWLYIKKEGGEIWEMQRLSAQPAPLPIKSSN
jgi:hypothetical protein